jgi:hypothetical protein
VPSVSFGMWIPDHTDIGEAPHVIDAKNVLPVANHYIPVQALSATTNALTSRCRGAFPVRDIDGAAHMYAYDGDIWELESGSTWTDRSKVGGYTTPNENTRARATTYGDRFILTNGLDTPQYIDMSTAATDFADLGGSPPAARYIATYLEFVFLAALSTNLMTIKWSAAGSSTSWTPGTGQSDEQEFADGGSITGLVVTKAALYLFQEKCIRRILYVGGSVIMQIDRLVDGIGCIEPNSLVSYGQMMFFLDESGWYSWDGESQPQPIGVDKFDRWFLSESNRSYWYSMTAAIDPRNRVLAVGFASTNSGSGLPDTVMFYNYTSGWPSYARIDHEVLVPAISVFTSIDDLTGDVDTDFGISFDDPFWQGGTFYFAAFDTLHKLASFTGSNLEATLTLGPVSLFDGMRGSVEWIKPISDTTAATCAGGAQVRPGDTITYQSAVAQQASGRCPQRNVNGFYLAAKTVIPAASTWTYARGIEFKAKAAGVR